MHELHIPIHHRSSLFFVHISDTLLSDPPLSLMTVDAVLSSVCLWQKGQKIDVLMLYSLLTIANVHLTKASAAARLARRLPFPFRRFFHVRLQAPGQAQSRLQAVLDDLSA